MNFLLFAGRDEPAGGAKDLIGLYPTTEAAETAFVQYIENNDNYPEWGHIFDSSSRKIIVSWAKAYRPENAQEDPRLPSRGFYGERWWRFL